MDVALDTDASCVSLEYRRRAPCAKPLSPRARRPRCPARGPEPDESPPPCRNDVRASGKRRKRLPPGGRRSPHRSAACATGVDVRVPCGAENYDLDFPAGNNWYDETGYSSAFGSDNRSFQSDLQRRGREKGCASDKRRNALSAKLRELLSETEPIPDSCLLDNAEAKPEPEVLAEVLLMSEAEGIDLAEVKPDSVFDNLFAEMSFGRSINVTLAAPDSMMSDVVVPIHVTSEASASFEMPNMESLMESTRNAITPSSNAFQQSAEYETFATHMTDLLERKPVTDNVSELLGSSVIVDDASGTRRIQDSIVEYVMKPGPSTHASRVRLNGSTRPIWFPGYVLVSPSTPGCVRMTDDPGEALDMAWRLCQPRNFHEESRYLVDIG